MCLEGKTPPTEGKLNCKFMGKAEIEQRMHLKGYLMEEIHLGKHFQRYQGCTEGPRL